MQFPKGRADMSKKFLKDDDEMLELESPEDVSEDFEGTGHLLCPDGFFHVF